MMCVSSSSIRKMWRTHRTSTLPCSVTQAFGHWAALVHMRSSRASDGRMLMGGLQQFRWAARRGGRWLRQRFTPSALILMYHRIIDLPTDPQLLAVSPKHFAEHLEVVQRYARAMTLTELVGSRRGGGRIPNRAIV